MPLPFELPWKRTASEPAPVTEPQPEPQLAGLLAPAEPTAPQVIALGDDPWPEYEDRETGAVVHARQRVRPGLMQTEAGEVRMEAGDYVVAPPKGGRRVIHREVFEARFQLREGE